MTAQKPLCLVLLMGLFGCGSSSVPTIETTTFAPALDVQLQNSTKTANGVYYRDLAAGTGAAIAAGQTLSVRYTGWLADGTRFDSNDVSTGKPLLQFVLSTTSVIAGFVDGLPGARVGGTRQLIIPPALGYGAAGSPPAIPPNAILVFTVQIASSP